MWSEMPPKPTKTRSHQQPAGASDERSPATPVECPRTQRYTISKIFSGNVLFRCTGNSCRRQVAEGWLRHDAGDRAKAFRAGTKPAGLNPITVTVMREARVDISGHYSKHVDDLASTALEFRGSGGSHGVRRRKANGVSQGTRRNRRARQSLRSARRIDVHVFLKRV